VGCPLLVRVMDMLKYSLYLGAVLDVVPGIIGRRVIKKK